MISRCSQPTRPNPQATLQQANRRRVSALAQTITLEVPDWLTPRALNSTLPADVRAWASADAPDDFHATHHATRRTYTYYLHAPESAVDDDRFAAACEALSGSHDFHNLTPDDHNTERAPTLEATREGHYLVVTVTAGGFARELVRQLVSLAHDVGTGNASLETLERALDPDPLPGHKGISPAPPEPLVLTAVDYPALEFTVDPEAAERARAVFETRRLEHQTAARVAGISRWGPTAMRTSETETPQVSDPLQAAVYKRFLRQASHERAWNCRRKSTVRTGGPRFGSQQGCSSS